MAAMIDKIDSLAIVKSSPSRMLKFEGS
jgi:hypothetical protein